MSGGSYNYIYSRLSDECENSMYDVEMNDLITDLCVVLHDLEWWQSGDSSEEKYRKTLSKFKKKWFKGDREQRLKEYIDKQISVVRSQLYSLIDEPNTDNDLDTKLKLIEANVNGYTQGLKDASEQEKCTHPDKCYECEKILTCTYYKQEPKMGYWVDNHNGTISCSHCHTWFNKDDRYYYMLYCPYCNVKITEREDKMR